LQPSWRPHLDREKVITEPQSAVANLFAEHPIFFNQIIDDVVLMLVHPSGNGGDEE